MKEILKLLGTIPQLTPILAFRSLFSWEGEYGNQDDDCFWTESRGQHRVICGGPQKSPLIMSHEDGETIHFTALPELKHSAELCTLVQALGLVLIQRKDACELALPGLGEENGTVDAERLWNRLMAIDDAWCFLHRGVVHLAETMPQRISAVEEAYTKADQWARTRMAWFENGDEGTSFTYDFTALKIQDLDNWTTKGLKSVEVLSDVRGPALVLTATSGEKRSVCSMQFNWRTSQSITIPAAVQKVTYGRYDVRPTQIPADIHAVLADCTVEGKKVFIRQRLSPKTYKKVNEALNALGGVWSKSHQAHLFDQDPGQLIEEVVRNGHVFTWKDYEFFWTSADLAARVAREAGIKPGMKVLEPNAGDGALAREAALIVGVANVTCFELMPRNVEALRELGFEVEKAQDFLSIQPEKSFDVVLMNPPFSGGRDMAHVQHAFKFLLPGGRLVAIASTQWQTHTTAPAAKFRAWLDELGASVSQIPRGAFKSAGTDVETTLIVINAGKQSVAPKPTEKHVKSLPLQLDLAEMFA